MQRNCHPLVVALSGGITYGLLIDQGQLLTYGVTVVTIVVLWMVSQSSAAKGLFAIVSTTAEKRKAALDEKDAELARLTVELKVTTRELRQAREFTDEDRLKIRTLEIKCQRYEREINVHRLGAGMPPLLAGSEDDEQHKTS
jgi:hypothetical protein